MKETLQSPRWWWLLFNTSIVAITSATVHAQIVFGPVQSFRAAIGRMASADLDGDGDEDLVTDDGGSGRVSVLLNNGDGTFAPAFDVNVPMGTRSLIAADVNMDTHVDLVVARTGVFPAGNGIISVLLNQGNATFGAPIDYPVIVSTVPGQQMTPLSLAAADFDKNGTVDLAAATVMLNQVGQPGFFSLMFNAGNVLGQPVFGDSINIDASQSFSLDIVAEDLDKDTDVDLAIVSALGNSVNSVSVVLNNGDGSFGPSRAERLTGASTTARKLIVDDINGDTFVDLVTINGAHTYSVQLNLAGGIDPAKAGQFKDQGQFPLGSQALPATDVPTGGAALRDLDLDGNVDLIAGLAGDGGPGSLAVFVNPGPGLLGPEMSFASCFDFGALIAEDLDNDGDIDVAAVDASLQRILVLLNEVIPPVVPSGDPNDADGDGVNDCTDGCPFDPAKTAPGVCGCAGSFITGSCDDGDACTTADACVAGVCVGGPPPDCNDANVCTDDSCDSTTGCLHTPVPGRACDDANACTTVDTCDVAGTCIGSVPPNCDDGNVCTDDSCDPTTGCTSTNNTAPCSDGSACTTGDICSAGTCVAGMPVNCDDSNLCTDDSCDVLTGCANIPVSGRACDDGNACTTGDACDAAGVCTGIGGACGAPIPTVSSWGLIIMTLLFLVAGTLAVYGKGGGREFTAVGDRTTRSGE